MADRGSKELDEHYGLRCWINRSLTVETRLRLIRQVTQLIAKELEPNRERLRPENLELGLEIVIKTVLTLAWLGLRDNPAQMQTGGFQREVATMIRSYLLEDPTR